MALSTLLELNELAKKEGEKYGRKREFYAQIVPPKGKHFKGIVGPRGVGKTVLLQQIAQANPESFYLSLDTLQDEDDLFEIAKTLAEKLGIRLLLLDEVHFQKGFDQKLKKIFDFLPLNIVFTSSVSLSLYESSYDLSRRAKLHFLYPFSFREYLFFKDGVLLPALSLQTILEERWPKDYLKYAYRFEEYLSGGLFPFSLEEPDVLPIFKNILKKIVQKDIPSVYSLKTEELTRIEKTVDYIGRAPVDGVNFTSVAKNIGISKYKGEDYLRFLERAFVLNLVFPFGTNVLKEPKVLMCLPYRLLYQKYREALGALREDFFVEMMRMRGLNFHYLKTKRGAKTPDFLVKLEDKKWVLEIGGQGKGRQQFKGFSTENKKTFIHTHNMDVKGIPLSLLGFM